MTCGNCRKAARARSGGFKELYLDPDCDFVSIKSAESDGVGSVVALEHFESCACCQGYHKAMVQKKGLALGLRVQREVDRLREERDVGLKAIQHAQRLAKARLGLLLAYFDDSLIGKVEVRQTSNYPQDLWCAEVELKTKPIISLRANARTAAYQYAVKGWPNWSGEIAQIDLILKNVASELAKAFLDSEGKGERDES
jgi:hypothetical protein